MKQDETGNPVWDGPDSPQPQSYNENPWDARPSSDLRRLEKKYAELEEFCAQLVAEKMEQHASLVRAERNLKKELDQAYNKGYHEGISDLARNIRDAIDLMELKPEWDG